MEEVCALAHGGEEEKGADAAMLWSLQEALEKQTLQIGASACGATAVVDVLKALSMDVAPEEVDRCVQTRLRRNESALPDYLLSRSEAGKCSSYMLETLLSSICLVVVVTFNFLEYSPTKSEKKKSEKELQLRHHTYTQPYINTGITGVIIWILMSSRCHSCPAHPRGRGGQ